MSHISASIQEVMESYEVTLNNKTIPLKGIKDLSGHNILRYKIHGDKQVPFVKTRTSQRMEEGDVFAIETFGSTGRGSVRDDVGVYGYGRNENVSARGLKQASAKSLLKLIDENFGTVVFSRRYLERLGVRNYHLGLKTLVANGIVEQHGPLVDVPGSYVAQFEHVSGDFQGGGTSANCDRLFCLGPTAKRSSRVVMTTESRCRYWASQEDRMSLKVFACDSTTAEVCERGIPTCRVLGIFCQKEIIFDPDA